MRRLEELKHDIEYIDEMLMAMNINPDVWWGTPLPELMNRVPSYADAKFLITVVEDKLIDYSFEDAGWIINKHNELQKINPEENSSETPVRGSDLVLKFIENFQETKD